MVKPRRNSRFAKLKGQTRLIVDIVFGVASRDCAGFGICKMEPKGKLGNTACHGCLLTAEIYPASPAGVGLIINRDKLSDIALERYFAFDYFVVECDFPIPTTTWQRYGKPQVIRKGFYPIQRHEDSFQITFSSDSNLLSKLK